jgi:hypothetical protein
MATLARAFVTHANSPSAFHATPFAAHPRGDARTRKPRRRVID